MLLIDRLLSILRDHPDLQRDLEILCDLELPYGCIAAGYVRNYVWDHLHGYKSPTMLNDVDVLYFDPSDLTEESEKRYDLQLRSRHPEYNWSCKNQARMHIRNGEEPYTSVADAMRRWPETATAIGVRLDHNRQLEIIAPHGLEDLVNLILRRSSYFHDEKYFYARIHSKNWLNIWPKLTLLDTQDV